MNLHPKVRPLWQRLLIVPSLCVLMVYKALHLPRKILPRALRSIVTHWHYRMFWTLISSGVSRAYIDEPCEFRMPTTLEPKAEVESKYQFKSAELKQFYEDGFIGPIDAFSSEEMADFRNEMLAIEHTKSETYGFCTPRDRHLEMPRLWNYMTHPAITERVAQLLGPDLLCWRSQLFYKPPHSPAIQSHQASTFMVEDYLDPAIFPPNKDEMFQLTVWVAVDEAVPENGCLQFVRGTHDQIRTIRFGGEEGFYNANYSLEYDKDANEVVTLPVKAGQFVIFTERCIHGSPPNTTDRHRLAFNIRVIPTDTPVYPNNKRYYRSVYNGGKYFLDNWGVTLLRGEDRHQLSRSIDASTLGQEATVPLRRAG
jgi:non-heme Fe2+,alpha-ketoglutarate-dependent halogenase